MRSAPIIALLTLLVIEASRSEPVVIYNSGRVQPLPNINKPIRVPIDPPKYHPGTQRFIPVITPELTPGRVQARKIRQPALRTPLFIVGDDELSRQWLTLYRQQLKQLNAVGYAVNVRSPKTWRELKQVTQDLPITPIHGGKIAKQLSLTHYPVLISRNRIEQ